MGVLNLAALLHGPCNVESLRIKVHVLSLYFLLEILRAPFTLTQADKTISCAVFIGSQSKVNPGGLSDLLHRISLCLCVLYSIAWEKSQNTRWSFGQYITSTSDPSNLNPSLSHPLLILTCWHVLGTLCSNNSVMSTTSLLIAICRGIPIFRYSPIYTVSDSLFSDISMSKERVEIRNEYVILLTRK